MPKHDLYKISEIKLTYQPKVKAVDRPKITCSEDAYTLFRQNWDDLTINLFEEFKVALLDRSNRCIGLVKISQGGITGTLVDTRLVFVAALKARATAMILSHNHPSGNLKPSKSDVHLTKKMIEAGKILDVQVLDHLILTQDDYYSMSDFQTVNFVAPRL